MYKIITYRSMEDLKAVAYVITSGVDDNLCSVCKKTVEKNNKCSIILGRLHCKYCSVALGINITYENGIFFNPLIPNCFGMNQISEVKYIS